jgi:OOP family OmpA-OmpF porin
MLQNFISLLGLQSMKTQTLLLISSISLVAASQNAVAHKDIPSNGSTAYVINTEGNIVRDRWDRCVRTIDWSKETAIAVCEGWDEKKPVVTPKPQPVAAEPAAEASTEPTAPAMPAPAKFIGYFDFDKSSLITENVAELDAFADYMQQNKDVRISVTGHTDSMGSDAYNQVLSEKRAQFVADYLISKGVAADRIQTKGMGETSPIVANDTIANRKQNRRVEVDITQ